MNSVAAVSAEFFSLLLFNDLLLGERPTLDILFKFFYSPVAIWRMTSKMKTQVTRVNSSIESRAGKNLGLKQSF